MWTGSMYMGSKSEIVDVIFDTASDWLSVESKLCTTCEGTDFDVDASTTAKRLVQDMSTRTYGGIKLLGREYTDKVCLTPQACINDFEFFLVEE